MIMFRMLLLLQVLVLSGCMRYVYNESPSHANSRYLNPAKDLSQIGRTVLVELKNDCIAHHISPDVTEALFQEIQKEQLFGVSKVQHDDPDWQILHLDKDAGYTFEEMAQIRKTFKSDAILTGTITVYEPYPHMTLGLRLRLIDLSDSQLIWALEQVWDTTDKKTRDRIEAYYSPKKLMPGDENLGGQLGFVSPLKFFKFVAHEVTETLNSRR